MTMTSIGAARANANIALIKYWGKRDTRLNLPAVGSISVTLEDLYTDTEVSFTEGSTDEFLLNGERREAMLPRVTAQLDLLRQLAGTDQRAEVVSRNNFPTGAGLASSASGFAALTAAAARALQLDLTPRALSRLARRGSASAARSLFGGFVELKRGQRDDDDEDCYAEPLLAAEAWPLEVVVAVTDAAEKSVSSRDGMLASAESAYFPAWVATSDADLQLGRQAILTRDFAGLAAVAEASCLKMHGLMLATAPGLLYWQGPTLACLHRIRALRDAGTGVFFTVDAGPQVKAVCEPGAAERVREALAAVPGVTRTWVSGLGAGVSYL